MAANANLKARPTVSERFVTIQQSRRDSRTPIQPFKKRTDPPFFPWIRLAGRWIEHAGFHAGQRVKVAVEHGKLTITCE
ncbi:SymE family type I addiction module toxin [Caballeronia sp. BR00000012568055]|uniref:SymE family type I addiction module toxin n=1 Tax=Caballeronia sp. BR00000012568055 TaxID=2918761 RepID=UPI0023F7B46F|nr:SymE family type I addiction module toxin [Caballeronia sp. BR00000012568055]